MRRLLRATIRTSPEIKRFRDKLFHGLIFDHKRRNQGQYPEIYYVEAQRLVQDVMDKLAFLNPVAKSSNGKGSVQIKVGIYSDQQHELDKWAYSVGIRGWKPAVQIYYALLKQEEESKCRKRI